MRKLLVALGGLFLCLTVNAQNVAVGSLTAQGADCTTAGACITLQFESNDVASASIQLSGTFTATVQFEASSDKGTTWVAISGTPLNSSTAVTSATTANTWKFNVASITNIRARASAWTSAPTVIIRSSRAVANAIGGGGTSLPALSDNGTNVISTEPLILPANQPAAAIGMAGNITDGISFDHAASGPRIWTIASGARRGFLFDASTLSQTMSSTVVIGWNSSATDPGGTVNDMVIRRRTTANLALGNADTNGVPVAQTISVQNAITGTDLAGSTFTIDAPLGTGLGAGSKTCLNRALMKATGTTAQTATNGFCVGESKTLSNTSATAQILANISVPSNSAGGVEGTINVNCTDGTNFDSETQSFNTSFVNKAGTVTVTAPVITATSAANNSGSCTAGITAVANGNGVDIKVTPVFGTIVPTTTTGTVMKLTVMAGGNVTIN